MVVQSLHGDAGSGREGLSLVTRFSKVEFVEHLMFSLCLSNPYFSFTFLFFFS